MEKKRFPNKIKEAGKAGGIILSVLVLLMCLVKLCNYLVVDDVNSYTRLTLHELYEQQGQIETVFIGSSHCYRAYDPALYGELTGETAFNLGSSSQNYDTSYYLLKEAVACQPIKKVYLDMHLAFMFTNPENRDLVQANIISDYMRPSLNKLDFILHMSGSADYTNSLLPFRRNWRLLGDFSYLKGNLERKNQASYREYAPVVYENDVYMGNGFVASSLELIPEEITWWDKFDKLQTEGESSFARMYLDKIVALCQKEDIELIFVTAPSCEEYLDVAGPYDPAHDYMQAVADSYGISYLDFNMCKKEYMEFESQDFMDVDHLNGKGAQKITKGLVELMNSPSLIDEYFASCYDER